MNIKVVAFTVSEKSSNMSALTSSGLGGSSVVNLLFMYLLLFVGVLCWALF